MYQFGRRLSQRRAGRPFGNPTRTHLGDPTRTHLGDPTRTHLGDPTRTHSARAVMAPALLALVVLAAGCGSSAQSASSGPSATGSSGAVAAVSSAPYYLSLGDSYAAGYQPTGPNQGSTNTNGFAYQTVTLAKARGQQFRLVNLGCAGVTTTSILHQVGCNKILRGPGAPAYDSETQAAAATAFLRQHRGQVGLITVSIGGNDVTDCVSSPDVLGCVTTAINKIKTNVAALAVALRAAAGPDVQMIGLTYPDVILGEYLSGVASYKSLVGLSVTAFKTLINPALETAYAQGGGSFIDVTAATGAYGPMTEFTTVPKYGRIPTPVAKICTLTYFCLYGDIHPKTPGYTQIAQLLTAQLPQRG
jgi:lysophospholipase L1-like esterase